MRIVDAHNHLQDDAFDADRADVIGRAEKAGVEAMVCNASAESDWQSVIDLAKQHAHVIPSVGLHPWYVKERSKDWAGKLEWLLAENQAGVGEIGLDRWIEDRDEAAQEEVFRTQLALARKYEKPAMIHCLQAWGPMADIMRQEKAFDAGVLFHAYGGPVEFIDELAAKNAYFSFAGSTLREKNTRAKAAAKAVPLERLLIETDSPDIPLPRHLQMPGVADEKRNEPANAAAVLKGLAQLRGIQCDELGEILWQNAKNFLKNIWKQ